MIPVVGIIGAAGSGKTTFASHLNAQHAYEEYSFASPLKDMCAQQFGWDRKALDFDDAAQALGFSCSLEYKEALCPQTGKTRRQVLQHIGTEGFRAMDVDHWVKQGKQDIQHTIDMGLKTIRGVIIGDVRFQNEVDAIKAFGGYIVRIHKVEGADGTEHSAHSSELLWSTLPADYEAHPAFGLEFIRSEAEHFLTWMQNGRHV